MKKLISYVITLMFIFACSSLFGAVFAVGDTTMYPDTNVPGILWILIIIVVVIVLFILSIFLGKKKK